MDLDEDHGRRGIAESDPLPPDEWQGFTAGARVEAIYTAHGAELTRYIRRRAPAQDVADLVQECFRRFAQSRGSAASLIDRPAAYLVQTARNLLAERARAARHLRGGSSSPPEGRERRRPWRAAGAAACARVRRAGHSPAMA